MSAPIKVAYLIDKFGAGGAQTHLAGLVTSLDRERFQPEVLCLSAGGWSADRVRALGYPVHVLGAQRIYGPTAALCFLRLLAWLRAQAPDLIHTYMSSANVFGALASRMAATPCLITSRRDRGHGDGWMMVQALRLTSPSAHRVVAVSEDAARVARERERVDPAAIAVIANGIDLVRFRRRGQRLSTRAELGVPEDAPLVVTVAHLTPVKGIDVLVEAAPMIHAEFPKARFVVTGGGAEREALAARIEALRLGDRFRLAGDCRTVPELLEAADLFVLPSRAEGQPNAVLEAMAMELPVVATRVGGVPELLRHEAEGLLVEPENPEALARGCRAVLRSPELAARLGRSGRERVERNFDVRAMARRYQQLYQAALGRD